MIQIIHCRSERYTDSRVWVWVCVWGTTSHNISALVRETEKWNCMYKISDSI